MLPSRLALSRKWFSQENFHFCWFVCILSEKIPAELSKNGLHWQKNNWEKWFFKSNDLILDIGLVTSNKIYTISGGNFNSDVNTAISASKKKTTSGETSFFFRINYQFHFILRFWGLLVGTFSEKKIRTFRTAFNASGGKFRWKNVFFWNRYKFTQLFRLWPKYIREFV